MYQCFVRNEHEMAQGIAELRLGGELNDLEQFQNLGIFSQEINRDNFFGSVVENEVS